MHRTRLPRMKWSCVLELENKREYTRNICLPFATREASTFLKLLQYDLVSASSKAPIVGVYLTATPVHPRVVQGGIIYSARASNRRSSNYAGSHHGDRGARECRHTRASRHTPARRISPDTIPCEAGGRSTVGLKCAEPRLAIRIYRPPLPAKVASRKRQTGKSMPREA